MNLTPLPNIWIDSIPTVEDTIAQIEICLNTLKENALIADFSDVAIRSQYSNDIIYMKMFFERAETLARAEQGTSNASQ